MTDPPNTKDIKQFLRDLQKLLHEYNCSGLLGAVITNPSADVLQLCVLTKDLATKTDCTTLKELTQNIDTLGDAVVEYVSQIQRTTNDTQTTTQTFLGPEPSQN